MGWAARTRRAWAFGLTDVDTALVALAGFLLRGGIVLLILPSVVLPSVIGIAGATGVDAFGIDGRPTPWLYEVVAIVSTVAALWLILALAVGSLIDVWLIGAALDPEGGATSRRRALPDLDMILDLAGVRVACLVPVAAAIVWAGSRIYTAAYDELDDAVEPGHAAAVARDRELRGRRAGSRAGLALVRGGRGDSRPATRSARCRRSPVDRRCPGPDRPPPGLAGRDPRPSPTAPASWPQGSPLPRPPRHSTGAGSPPGTSRPSR